MLYTVKPQRITQLLTEKIMVGLGGWPFPFCLWFSRKPIAECRRCLWRCRCFGWELVAGSR